MSESVVVQDGIDESKRMWVTATCGVGAVAGLATAVPFVSTFAPSERAKAAGASVEVDISDLKLGEKKTVEWRGQPDWKPRDLSAGLSDELSEVLRKLTARKREDRWPSMANLAETLRTIPAKRPKVV